MKTLSETASRRVRAGVILCAFAAAALWRAVLMVHLPWIEWADVDAALGWCALATGAAGALVIPGAPGRQGRLVLLAALVCVAGGVGFGWMGQVAIDSPLLLLVWILARTAWVVGLVLLAQRLAGFVARIRPRVPAAAVGLAVLAITLGVGMFGGAFIGWGLAPGIGGDAVGGGAPRVGVIAAFLPALLAALSSWMVALVTVAALAATIGLATLVSGRPDMVCQHAFRVPQVQVCVARAQEGRLPYELGDVEAVARVLGPEMVPPMVLTTRADGVGEVDQARASGAKVMVMSSGVRARTAGAMVMESIFPLGECINSQDGEGVAVLRQVSDRARRLSHLPEPTVGEGDNPRHARAVNEQDALPHYPTVLGEITAGQIRLAMRDYGADIRQCHGRFSFFGVSEPVLPTR